MLLPLFSAVKLPINQTPPPLTFSEVTALKTYQLLKNFLKLLEHFTFPSEKGI